MSDDLPQPKGEERTEENKRYGRGGDSRSLSIDELHYYQSDIVALERLAQTDAKLAHKVVDQKEREDKREHTSYRVGLLVAAIVILMVLMSASYILVNLGIIASFGAIFLTVVISALARVILTGEWSDTSWIGQCISSLAGLLGSKESVQKGDDSET